MAKKTNFLKKLFLPPADRPIIFRILPYLILSIIILAIFIGVGYGWSYTDSPSFCGTTCHTMPPQSVTYLNSPHANVYCTECHIGRSGFVTQLQRKTEDAYEVYSMLFHLYEYPIQASRSRPARVTCEKCHQPETFVADSLLVVNHYQEDALNTLTSTYLVMKTGGGSKRQGLGKGIHWHIMNKVEYYSSDPLSQNIPYVRVNNDDGTITEYFDSTENINPQDITKENLKTVDCITCHNRVTHQFPYPSESLDKVISNGLVSASIPDIKKKGVEFLSASYSSQSEGLSAIGSLDGYYKNTYPDFYNSNTQLVAAAIQAIQDIYTQTVFLDQKVDWTTHPDNLGHLNSPGCFRCHDGKHLDAQENPIRLECNLCHSIPVKASSEDLVARLEISRGPEPQSHFDSNWIKEHHSAFNATCSNCHTIQDPGGVSNKSFCSNSACHGTALPFAGYDASALRLLLEGKLVTPGAAPTPAPQTGNLTFINNIEPILANRCTMCHGSSNGYAGLDLSSYAGIMKGGKDGPVIVSGDPQASKIIQVQSVQHRANLSPEELELVIQWIESGAMER